MSHHRSSSSGLTEDRYLIRISAKRRDVSLDPLQGGALVHVSVVADGLVPRLRGKRQTIAAP